MPPERRRQRSTKRLSFSAGQWALAATPSSSCTGRFAHWASTRERARSRRSLSLAPQSPKQRGDDEDFATCGLVAADGLFKRHRGAGTDDLCRGPHRMERGREVRRERPARPVRSAAEESSRTACRSRGRSPAYPALTEKPAWGKTEV